MAKKRTMNEYRQTKDSHYTNPWFKEKHLNVKKDKNYWVVHREQVSGKLQIECIKDKEDADLKQRQLRKEYHDVVVLLQEDINELYLQTKNQK